MKGPVDIGRMQQRVAVWAVTSSTPNTYGEPVKTETQINEVWAAVEPQGGSESNRAGKVESEQVYLVTIRAISTLTTKHWFVFDGKRLEIGSIKDVEANGEWQECLCKSVG